MRTVTAWLAAGCAPAAPAHRTRAADDRIRVARRVIGISFGQTLGLRARAALRDETSAAWPAPAEVGMRVKARSRPRVLRVDRGHEKSVALARPTWTEPDGLPI